ncbi:MAG: class I SAM-dependent methyltransferase [Deltaproteobacteria bacterium]|nr:MAG: class I SAM-dependent methyltransferase [Deltaproteobacteria bacterium]
MFVQDLRRELSRRFYIRSRTARTAALRIAYVAYSSTLNGWHTRRPEPQAAASLRRRIEQLFDEDWQDADAGLYPRELIEALPWREYALAVPKLLADLPRTRERIRNRRHDELPEHLAPRYPAYYARNFHYQTDGYLGHTSAELYDLQVELLFGGTADAMRRRLIPPVVRFARAEGHANGHAGPAEGRPLKLLDVACGTGHFLRMLGAALPGARLFGVDLSPHYLARARETLPREVDVSLVCENAESLPFPDGHFDAATNVFLLHELPPEVRARILAEMTRVVRPGGLVVVADSLQLRDAPELHHELHAFPDRFHEPYYPSYIRDDLAGRVREASLEVCEERLAFLTKVVVARRPVS